MCHSVSVSVTVMLHSFSVGYSDVSVSSSVNSSVSFIQQFSRYTVTVICQSVSGSINQSYSRWQLCVSQFSFSYSSGSYIQHFSRWQLCVIQFQSVTVMCHSVSVSVGQITVMYYSVSVAVKQFSQVQVYIIFLNVLIF